MPGGGLDEVGIAVESAPVPKPVSHPGGRLPAGRVATKLCLGAALYVRGVRRSGEVFAEI